MVYIKLFNVSEILVGQSHSIVDFLQILHLFSYDNKFKWVERTQNSRIQQVVLSAARKLKRIS